MSVRLLRARHCHVVELSVVGPRVVVVHVSELLPLLLGEQLLRLVNDGRAFSCELRRFFGLLRSGLGLLLLLAL